MFVLMNVVKAMYVESRQTDAEFANSFTMGQYANVDPTFFPVTDGNVAGARRALNIESNYISGRANPARMAATEVIDKLTQIESKLDRIIRHMSEIAKRDI